jgi:virulence-associated protein E
VFFGTSNEDEFLKDTTGNRRFYPLPVDAERVKKDIWKDLTEQEVDQIWAEVCFRVSLCEGNYDELEYQVLSRESRETLAKMHEEYSEKDPYESLVERFSEIMVPSNWLEMDLMGRRMYLDKLERGEPDKEDSPLMPMPYLSAQNVHCEMLRLEISSLKKQESNRYNKIIKQMKGWKKSTVRDVNYGKQRCYRPPDK